MMCDILLCSSKATFGQPEITLGILPGAGGTQRLTHLVGKARAMDIVLTGRFVKAEEAEKIGLVSRLVPGTGQEVVEEAIKVATKIAEFGGVAVQAAKEAVNAGMQSHSSPFFALEQRLISLLCSFGIASFRRSSPRTTSLPRNVRYQGPEGGYGSVCREATGKLLALVNGMVSSVVKTNARRITRNPNIVEREYRNRTDAASVPILSSLISSEYWEDWSVVSFHR